MSNNYISIIYLNSHSKLQILKRYFSLLDILLLFSISKYIDQLIERNKIFAINNKQAKYFNLLQFVSDCKSILIIIKK